MSDFNICETVGERGAGSSKSRFPHFILTIIIICCSYTEMLGK